MTDAPAGDDERAEDGVAGSSLTRRQLIGGAAALAAVPAIYRFSTDSVETGMMTPRLHVDGRWLRDPNGDTVTLRGLNTVDPWWGDEHQNLRGAAYTETLTRITDTDRGWHPRVVRVPYQHSVRSLGVQRTITEYMRPIVDRLKRRGCYAIIDFHRIERWDTNTIDAELREFWNAVAPAFADDENVLFEMFNEPTEPYGNGQTDWTAWKETAEPWVDLIRSHAPDTPIIVGSPRWSSYTKFARTAPFSDENVLYSTHIYPQHYETYDMDAIAAVADEYPVFMTEWGYTDEQDTPEHIVGTTSGYGRQMRSFLTDHPNMSWTAWCADSVWEPRMFDTDGELLGGDAHMGEFTKEFLSETD